MQDTKILSNIYNIYYNYFLMTSSKAILKMIKDVFILLFLKKILLIFFRIILLCA